MSPLRHLLLVVVLLFAQLAAGAHAVGHTEGKDKRCRGNNWFIPYETIMSRSKERPHPATFPVELARKCIALHGGNLNELTMLDPFLGIGHAASAAGDMGLARFIGFEIDPVYFDEAVSRVMR